MEMSQNVHQPQLFYIHLISLKTTTLNMYEA
jgi:hypothetical protein